MPADPAADVRAVVDATVAMAVLADERDRVALTAPVTDEVTAESQQGVDTLPRPYVSPGAG